MSDPWVLHQASCMGPFLGRHGRLLPAAQGREGLPSYTARRHSSGVCGEDVLVPVALDLASEDGSGALASTPSGSLYLDPSSPSATGRQHCKQNPLVLFVRSIIQWFF